MISHQLKSRLRLGATLTVVFGFSLSADAQFFTPSTPEPTFVRGQIGPVNNPAGETCSTTRTAEPPFYVSWSEGQVASPSYTNNRGQRVNPPSITRNFEELRAANRSLLGIVPRNSIVTLNGTLPYLANSLADVTVASVPTSQTVTAQNAARSPVQIGANVVGGVGQTVPVGTRGFIAKRFLRPAGQCAPNDLQCGSTFVVEQDAPMIQIPTGPLDVRGKMLRLSRNAQGLYQVNRCCTPVSGTAYVGEVVSNVIGSRPSNCRDNYVYEILNDDLTVANRVEMNGQCQGLVNALRPVPDNQARALINMTRWFQKPLEQFEMIDSRGLVKIPTDGTNGPYGSMHYTPENAATSPYDTFMNPVSACAFMQVLRAHRARCTQPGCQIQWGDAFHEGAWGAHDSHGKDSCIDIRPLKTVNSPNGTQVGAADYDWEKTRALLRRLVAAGAEVGQIGFQDPRAIQEFGTENWGGHSNHIHVCFPNRPGQPQTPQVQRTCYQGLPSGI